MAIEMYFINETKKQLLRTKKLYGSFEDYNQLICYLNICQGDTITSDFEDSEFINDIIYGDDEEYTIINLYEFNIDLDSELYNCSEFDRLYELVNK